MKSFNHIGLSGRIMLILGITGIAFVCLLTLEAREYRDALVERSIASVEGHAREAGDHFGHLIQKGRGVLKALSVLRDTRSQGAGCRNLLSEISADSRIQHLIRFNQQGRATCASGADTAQMDIGNWDVFSDIRTSDFAISEPFADPATGDPAIMLARRIEQDGVFRGAVAATFTMATAIRETEKVRLLHGSTVSVVDGSGTIIVRNGVETAQTRAIPRMPASMMQPIEEAGSGNIRVETSDGDRIVGFAELENIQGNQYAVVIAPEEAITSPAFRSMLWNIGLATILLMMALTAVFITLRSQIVTPVRRLLATTSRLAKGDYEGIQNQKHTGAGELKRLGGEIEGLADILASRERKLGMTVEHGQAVIENLPQAVCVLDREHHVVAANSAFVHNLGIPAELVRPGTDISAVIRYSAERGDYGHMGVEEAVYQWRSVLDAGQSVSFEKSGPHGETFAVQGRPLPDGGYLGVYSDITERKRLADTFAAFFENASRRDLDFDTRVTKLLEIGRQHFGLPVGLVARIRGDDYEILYSAAGREATAPEPGTVLPLSDMYCALALEKDQVISFEEASRQGFDNHRCYRRFGVEAYIGVPLYVEGELYGALNFHSGERSERALGESDQQVLRLLVQWLGAEMGRQRDYQRLRQAQSEIGEQRAYLEAVIDATEEGIAPVNQRGEIVTANSAMHRIFATHPDGLVGSSLANLFAPAGRGTVTDALAAIRGGEKEPEGKGRQIEASGLRADGTPFPAELYLAPMALKDSELVLAVIRDASEAHQAETIKNQFVSTVSHELRTPLTSIVGSLGLVRGGAAGELPPRAATLIDMAHRNASRLIGLVNDILDFERLRSGRIEVHPRSVDLGEQMEAARQNNAGYAEQAGCRLSVEPPDRPITVNVDPDRLQQVFSNLISNAAKFSPEGESVDVRTDTDDETNTVTVTVRDRGGGIPESVRDRLFQPFVQADPADNRKHQKGTGLGLAISRSILERMDGAIWVESEPGDTRFFVRLPIAEAADSA